jgi:hypothetical protein
MNKDERFDPEDLEAARAASVVYGKDEAEEQRLVALGRRAEALLASEDPPSAMREAVYAGGEYLGNAWKWFRSALGGE